MIVPIKIVVWFLKLVKWIHGVQNNSLVMNSPGSLYSPVCLDSPVVNTPGSLDSPVMSTPGADFLVYLEQASEQVYRKTFLWQIDQGVKTPRCNNNMEVLTDIAQYAKAPGIHCDVAGSIPAVTPRYCTKENGKYTSEHNKGKSWLPGIFCISGFFGSQFRSTPRCSISRESRLSIGEYNTESITNMNNSSNIIKNEIKWNSF